MVDDIDKPLGLRLIFSLYLSTILLLFFAIALQIFSGMKGWIWYIVIPLWAFFNLGLRILKTSFRNNLEAIVDDEIEFEDHYSIDSKTEDSSDPSETKEKSNANLTLLAVFAMLLVSTFWYGVGMILGRLF